MTPIVKAEELVFKFALKGAETEKIAIECALIVVDEIMQSLKFTEVAGNLKYLGYWNDVREEIETFNKQ